MIGPQTLKEAKEIIRRLNAEKTRLLSLTKPVAVASKSLNLVTKKIPCFWKLPELSVSGDSEQGRYFVSVKHMALFSPDTPIKQTKGTMSLETMSQIQLLQLCKELLCSIFTSICDGCERHYHPESLLASFVSN